MVCKGTSVCLVPMEIPGTGVNDGHNLYMGAGTEPRTLQGL